MIIVTNTSQITKDNGYKLVDRFDKVGKVEAMEGFLGLEVLLTDNLKEFDEVTISTRWESRQAFDGWMKSNAFKEAHSYKGGKPEYILNNKVSFYDVKIIRDPIVLG